MSLKSISYCYLVMQTCRPSVRHSSTQVCVPSGVTSHQKREQVTSQENYGYLKILPTSCLTGQAANPHSGPWGGTNASQSDVRDTRCHLRTTLNAPNHQLTSRHLPICGRRKVSSRNEKISGRNLFKLC